MAPFRRHSQTSSLCSIPEERETVFVLGGGSRQPVEIVQFDNSAVGGSTRLLACQTSIYHQRHDSVTSLTPRPANSSINKIIQATEARRTRKEKASLTMPYPRRASSVDGTTPQLGDSKCAACDSNSSHRLIPCQHTLCYDHFLEHYDDSHHRTVCARCHQVVIQLLDLSDKSKITVLTSPFGSPQPSIWSNSPPPRHSIDEHLSTMTPANGAGATVDNSNNNSSPWNNNKSGTANHSRYPSAPSAMSNPPRAHAKNNSISFDPMRVFHDPQSRPNMTGSQQDTMRIMLPAPPVYQLNMQQPMNSQYPHMPMYPRVGGQQQQPDRYPYSNMQQPPMFQPMVPQQPISMPQHPNMQQQQQQQQQPYSTQPGYTYYQQGPYGNIDGLPAHDPFSNSNPNRPRAQTFHVQAPAGPKTTFHGHNSMSVQNFSTPVKSPEPQTEAARLAQAIKDGLWDEISPKSAPSARNITSPPPKDWTLQQPVVRSQAAIVPETRPDPAFLANALNGVPPSIEEAFAHVPFVEQSRHHKSATWGVIKISNIPYGTTKNEVIAVLGRNTRIVSQPPGTPFYAIHIIMERSTGKTMDCFVELETPSEAHLCISNYQNRLLSGRAPRIGDRHVEIELSSQEALMRELFPRAKCVQWNGQVPTVYTTTEPFNSGFNGFLTGEEMVMVQKHAETPQRSPFAQRCHNRTYESVISTLHKYPWFDVTNISIRERTLLFKVCVTLLRSLMLAIRKASNPTALHRGLLQELVTAALTNAGFNHQQKSFVADLVHGGGHADLLSTVPYVHLGALGGWWAFEVLAKKPDASFELVDYFVALLRSAAAVADGTQQTLAANGTLAQRSVMAVSVAQMASPFGAFAVEIEGDIAEMNLAEVAAKEWDAVEAALRRVLVSGGPVLAIGDGSVGN